MRGGVGWGGRTEVQCPHPQTRQGVCAVLASGREEYVRWRL